MGRHSRLYALATRWLVALPVVALTLVSSTIPVGSAGPTAGDLSDDQYTSVRENIWAADRDFGGYSVDFTTHTLFLHPVAGRSGTTSLLKDVGAIAAVNDGMRKLWAVRVVSVRYSLAELRAVQAQVMSLKPWHSYLSLLHVDTAVNAVHLGFTKLPEPIAREARSRFGDRVHLAIDPAGAGTTRNNDSAPWWGGDYIDGSSGSCTGGFPVIRRSNGERGMLTAGHCFALNDTVYQHYPNTMGTVRWRQWGDWQTDLEYFDAPGGVQEAVYTGCQDCDTYQWVNGVGVASVGAIVCADGFVSGLNCSVGINWIDGCVFMTTHGTTYYTCGLAQGLASDGGIISQGGDSGGPVVRYISGGFVQAYGIITGNSRPVDSNGNAQPSSDVIFVEWQTISPNFRAICYTQSNCG